MRTDFPRLNTVLFGCLVLVATAAFGQESRPSGFGRMFNLQPYQPPDALLQALALSMKDPNAPVNDNPGQVPSGFTYLGQFLDHDITLDTTPLGDANINTDAMVNGRTPRLDLDSMYGGGPAVSP